MGLDKYGFPATIIANTILIEQKEFGNSARQLEKSWNAWLHYNPFDAAVAEQLVSLYKARIEKLDPQNDGERRQLMVRKLKLVKARAERYQKDKFLPAPR